MESSPIPGEDKLLLWDQAAFERRKDSDQEKELLKEDLVLSGRLNDAPLLRLFDIQRLPEGGGEANYPA